MLRMTPEAPVEDEPCDFLDFECRMREQVGELASGIMTQIVQGALDGAAQMFSHVATAWFAVPAPSVGNPTTGAPNSVLAAVQQNTGWLVLALGTVSLIISIMRFMWTQRADDARNTIKLLVYFALTQGTLVAGVSSLVLFSEEASPWLMRKIAGAETAEMVIDGSTLVAMFLGAPQELMAYGQITLVMTILLALATLMQIIFMLVRAPLIILMMAFVPFFAVTAGTPEGEHRFKRALAWLVAFVIYKPVAAVIIGVASLLIKNSPDVGTGFFPLIWGLIAFGMAGLALPALIKLLVPPAGVGSSAAYSGGTALAAGAAAAGAVVISGATLASGGAAAGAGATAGGAGAAAGGAGGAAPGAAIPSSAGGTASSGAGGAAAGAPPGGSGRRPQLAMASGGPSAPKVVPADEETA